MNNPSRSMKENVALACNFIFNFLSQHKPAGKELSINFIHTAKRVVILCIVLGLSYLYVNTAECSRLINISQGDEWSYLKGSALPHRYWTHIGFNPAGWRKGPSGFGYGSRETKTVLDDMRGNYKKVYARREFSIPNPNRVNRISLSLACDGPFIAYINGIEVIRNSRGISSSLPLSDEGAFIQMDISGFAHELLPGVNVLSVQCENDNLNSNDFTFIPLLEVHEE